MVSYRPHLRPAFTGLPEAGIAIREARGQAELAAVLRFRYEHFFKRFPDGFPGLDHGLGRVFEPHDLEATHWCAFDAWGELIAVSTATPAGLGSVPEAWRRWFDFAGLGARRLGRAVVSTRMVLRPGARHTDFFGRFHRALLDRYREAGIAFTLHYCRPDLVARYEALGHRRYHLAFALPTGQLRAPMILALGEDAAPGGRLALPKDFVSPAFCLMPPRERLAYLGPRLAGTHAGLAVQDTRGRLDTALGLAAPLRLKRGQILSPSPDEACFGLVLAGSFAEKSNEARRQLGPGDWFDRRQATASGADVYSLAAKTAGEVLVFDANLARFARFANHADELAPEFWGALGAAGELALARAGNLPVYPA